MIPEQQNQLKVVTEVAFVAAANAASWGLQDSVAAASLFLSVCTTLWVLAQLVRFIQKWIREERVFAESQQADGASK
jgi:hypothetical protein